MFFHFVKSSAQHEEIKIQRIQRQKEARLKQFQEDVKRRVLAIDKAKRRQQLDRSQRAVSQMSLALLVRFHSLNCVRNWDGSSKCLAKFH